MEVKRLRTLALETFKTLNDLNPAFMKNLFAKQELSKRRKNNLEIPNRNTAKYGDKSNKESWTTYLEWPFQKKSKMKLLKINSKST